MRASYDFLSSEKAYVIHNGIIMFIWIGLRVPQTWMQDVFNSNSVAQFDVENVSWGIDTVVSRSRKIVVGKGASKVLFLTKLIVIQR